MSSEKIGDSQIEFFEGYTGRARKLLQEVGAKKGSRLLVRTKDAFEVTGLVIPRYEGGKSDHIVLKLKSGYNVGISSESIDYLKIVEESTAETSSTDSASRRERSKHPKTVLLLSTGGTIASKVDYRTGAVKPAYTADDLYSSVPELGEISNIKPEVVFSSLSENLSQSHWEELSAKIISESSDESSKIDGIVVMLGTDTLAYVSAALSFSLIGLPQPVVCVGAQRSSDRPSADSALNLLGATRFAADSKISGVFVAMHKSENDDVIAIHSGVRVRKNHTSRRDAFQSIDVPHVAEVNNKSEVRLNANYSKQFSREDFSKEIEFKTRFESRVSLVKFHPGFDPSILDYLESEKQVRGIVIEGTGLGHVSSKTVDKIAGLVRNGVFVGIASQCIWGHVDLNVYETGIDLINAGAFSLGNMISETAYVKLSWVLGNFDKQDVSKYMTRNISGEITERIPLKAD